jgi:hypothetical protein
MSLTKNDGGHSPHTTSFALIRRVTFMKKLSKEYLYFLILFFLAVSVQAELKIAVKKFPHTFTDREMEDGHYANPHASGDGAFYEQELLQIGEEYGPKGATNVDIYESYVLDFGKSLEYDRYLLTPIKFMWAEKKDEVCTPIKNSYKCKQGQAYTNTCFLAVAEDGPYPKLDRFYEVVINEPRPLFCNEISAVGIYDGRKNKFLVTVRYFSLPQGAASSKKATMTVLFEAKKMTDKDGTSLVLIQDDACLGNPNRIDTISEARKALAACAKSKNR